MKSPEYAIPESTHNQVLPYQQTHPPTLSPQADPVDNIHHHDEIVWAKPFDRFRINGGGAAGDIFRRFKICKSEEEDFMVHWCRNNITLGIFTRDNSGVLEFRVSSSDLSDLTEMGIGRHDLSPDVGTHWTHVYDEHGVSWLTQFHYADHGANLPMAFDILGESMSNVGRIGRYGPSGLTPSNFYRRMQARAHTEKNSVSEIMHAEQ
ncbi:hypothetical protein B0J11DRAFT_502132 [Dendryphion nanum]|uniref:Uncharacterized protein n=1 Tax=Dendryphion nanum TaxID=256645 RepID=A0A9P9IVP8_9PLEO|nr:hypothetical protein B0J11DRAFT_502132 [Dendryphion nanum]